MECLYQYPFAFNYSKEHIVFTEIVRTLSVLFLDLIILVAAVNGLTTFTVLGISMYVLQKIGNFFIVGRNHDNVWDFLEDLALDLIEGKTLAFSLKRTFIKANQPILYSFGFLLRSYLMQFAFIFCVFPQSRFEQIPEEWQRSFVIAFILSMILSAHVAYVINSYNSEGDSQFEIFPFLSILLQHTGIFGVMALLVYQDSDAFLKILIVKGIVVVLAILLVSSPRYVLYLADTCKSKSIIASALMLFSFISSTDPFISLGRNRIRYHLKQERIASQQSILNIRNIQFLEFASYFYLEVQGYNENNFLPTIVLFVIAVTNIILSLFIIRRDVQNYCSNNYTYLQEKGTPMSRASKIIQNSTDFRYIELIDIPQDQPDDPLIPFPQELIDYIFDVINYTPIPTTGFKTMKISNIYEINNVIIKLNKDIFFEYLCQFTLTTETLPERSIRFFEQEYQFSNEQRETFRNCSEQRMLKFGIDFTKPEHHWYPFQVPQTYLSLRNTYQQKMLLMSTFYKYIANIVPINPAYLLYDLYAD